MKRSSRLQPGLLDPMKYIFSFLMIYLTILASAQQPTQPSNDLRVSHVSVIDSLQIGSTSILIIFRADYQGEVINMNCEIEFPSLVGPPDRYKICRNDDVDVEYNLYIAIREYDGPDDFQIEVKERPYEITYGEEVRLGSPIWRLNLSGRLAMRNIDWLGYYFELDTLPAPPFELLDVDEAEGRRTMIKG